MTPLPLTNPSCGVYQNVCGGRPRTTDRRSRALQWSGARGVHPLRAAAVGRDGGFGLFSIKDERTVVVGEAADGHQAIEAVEWERPDAVLMDVNMPRMGGVEATREIHRRWPETTVIGLSVQADSATEQSMLNAGAVAFVPKSGGIDHVIETILHVTERGSRTGE